MGQHFAIRLYLIWLKSHPYAYLGSSIGLPTVQSFFGFLHASVIVRRGFLFLGDYNIA